MSKRRKHKTKPENVMEQWRKIPIERRTWYYNQVFPEGTTSQSRRRFIYGEEGMKEAEKFEKWLENQTTLPRKIAWKMYEQIGMFDKNISILSKTRYKKVFEINHKWRVVFYIKTKRFYWYDINGKSRDQRAEHFAEILKGHNNIAKIVEPIYSEEQAIKILKRLMDLKNDEKMMENIARYKKYLTKKDYLAAKIEYKEICRKLKKMFGDKTYEALILYEVNIRALSNYLLNN